MTLDRKDDGSPSGPVGKRGPIAAIPFWKKLLVIGSIGLMIAGGVLSFASGDGGEPKAGSVGETKPVNGGGGTGSAGLASGFAPTVGGSTHAGGEADMHLTGETGDAEPQWSSAMFKLGFSFFVGFAVAFALRTFVKFSIVVIGLFLLVQFALVHYGFIEIHWDVFSAQYESVGDWLGKQFESLRAFMNGALPSGMSAMAGLALGFRGR